MELTQIIEIVIGTCLTIIGFFVARTIEKLESTLHDVATSVEELNTKVAVVIEKTMNHEKSIDDHDERIRLLERKK
jgi:uncharacterized protein YoxC